MDSKDICMPYDMFLNNIIAIKTLSDEINDGWELMGNMQDDYKAYLKKKIITNLNPIFSKSHFEDEASSSETQCLERLLVFEYHITYNISYSVPMLCFNVWDSDGKRQTMEEAWKHFDKKYSQENMYSVLTQQDHPSLQIPFLTLHPCKTTEILEIFLLKSKNPVISWLSSIGPAINLHLSNEYEKLTINFNS